MSKIIAMTSFDHTVTLTEYQDPSTYYIVQYGNTVTPFSSFNEAWNEFQSSSHHAAVCGGYVDAVDYEDI